MQIDILDWNITYEEFVKWVSTTGAEVDSITGYSFMGDSCTKYIFQDEEDYAMFKLAFQKSPA